MKRIELLIDSNGATKVVNATGFGKDCLNATANMERRLGAVDESSRELTDGYYADPEALTAEQGLG